MVTGDRRLTTKVEGDGQHQIKVVASAWQPMIGSCEWWLMEEASV
jgi:hypothetical protein